MAFYFAHLCLELAGKIAFEGGIELELEVEFELRSALYFGKDFEALVAGGEAAAPKVFAVAVELHTE